MYQHQPHAWIPILNTHLLLILKHIIFTATQQYEYNGSTVTGVLVKRAPRPTSPSEPQLWLVTPSDHRRRKNDKVSEADLRRAHPEDDVGAKTGSKSANSSQGTVDNAKHNVTTTSSTGSSSDSNNNKKRKSDDGTTNTSAIDDKKVTYQDQKKKKKSNNNNRVIGTRATRGSGVELFDADAAAAVQESLIKKKTKKIKKNEHVTVVQMLTGTLYLYRGETRRAEFVRSK